MDAVAGFFIQSNVVGYKDCVPGFQPVPCYL